MVQDVAAAVFRQMGRALDHLFSGGLTLQLGVHHAESILKRALEEHGEESVETASATERLMQADFALHYWRAAPAELRKAIVAAKRAGADMEDLRILTLNRELVLQDGGLQVRTHRAALPLTVAMAAVVFVGFLMLCAMAATAPAPFAVKVGVVTALLALFSFLYWGWSLYASRAIQAGHRLRAHLAKQQGPSNIVPIGRRVG